jgi:hypothetical protein
MAAPILLSGLFAMVLIAAGILICWAAVLMEDDPHAPDGMRSLVLLGRCIGALGVFLILLLVFT